MSEELNLSSDRLRNEELDVEGHMKREGAEDAEDKDENEVEAHLLNNNLLLENNLLENNNLLDL
jgi:hypothetical protein